MRTTPPADEGDGGPDNAFASQIPHAGVHIWQVASRGPGDGRAGQRGSVAYVLGGRAYVTVGSPHAPAGQEAAVLQAFARHAARQGRQVLCFGVSQALAQAAELRWLKCGEEPLFRAGDWAQAHRRPHTGRQVRRAERLGVQATRLACGQPGGERLLAAWQAKQGLPPLGFVARASLRREADGIYRWLARAQGREVGLAVLLPGGEKGTWLVEQLIRAPDAPNGTVELLVDLAMREVARRAPDAWVSLGVVALAGSPAWPLRLARRLGQQLYPFAGLAAFRRKLGPDRILPLGLAFAPRQGAAGALWALLCAFADNRPLRFFWRLCRSGPPWLLWCLTASLLPWTLALALAPAAWFAGVWTQRFWLGFDTFLLLALAQLAHRPSAAQARRLAWLVTADAGLTFLECLVVPGPPGALWLRCAMQAVLVLAPALAARVLWDAAARLGHAR